MTTPGIARIVVATDFSETSELALDYARAMAGRFGASIHLLHVLDEPPALSTLSSEMFVMEITALCATRHERTRQRLQRLLTPEEGVRFCATGEVRTGRAAETIRDVCGNIRADPSGRLRVGRSWVSFSRYSRGTAVAHLPVDPTSGCRQPGT